MFMMIIGGALQMAFYDKSLMVHDQVQEILEQKITGAKTSEQSRF